MFKQKFAAIERQMQAQLEDIRATHKHSGVKGDLVEEEIIRDFLSKYLPRRFMVGHGEVIDSDGNTSPQTDVVIVNESHPFTVSKDGPSLFFIEGVVGAGEVKSVLNSRSLDDAIEKSLRFKRLHAKMPQWTRTSLALGGHDFERFHVQRPYFVVAMESALSQETIEEKLVRSAENNPSFPHGLLDAIIVVSSGDNLIYVSPGPSKFMVLNEEEKPVHGWVTFGKGNALFRWLHWLHTVIPYDVPTASILERYLRAEANEEK